MPEESRSRASDAMNAYAEGDASAFAIVYDELAPRLLAYLRRRSGSSTVAEDVLQQTFLQMHRARGRFVAGARVEPWAYAIARRLLIDWARANKTELALEYSDDVTANTAPSPETSAQLEELGAALDRELARVPAKLREAFLLVRVENLSVQDAALVLGATTSATKLRAHRVGLRLRERLGDFFDRGGTK